MRCSLDARAPLATLPPHHTMLPLEIQLSILDEFEGQTIELRELCCVCLAWAEYAQAMLFRSIGVRSDSEDRKRFLAVLNTERNIGRHVMALRLNGSGYCNPTLDELDHTLIEQLPGVRTLDLVYKHLRATSGPGALQPSTKWAAISRLHLRHCCFGNVDALIALVAAFPRLESLDIAMDGDLECPDSHFTPTEPPAQPRSSIRMPAWHLKYLALARHFRLDEFVDWMAAEPATLVVDHLRIVYIGYDASVFNALLRRIGRRLRHLDLPDMSRRGSDWPDVPLLIRPCTALTALTFSARGPIDPRPDILSVLAQVASAPPSITTVSFHVIPGWLGKDFPWEEVDARLTANAFALLHHVEFQIVQQWSHFPPPAMDMTYQLYVRYMVDRMVLLKARGLLRFIDVREDSDQRELVLPWRATNTT
ncbi:hypothetical protein GGX14DRAFT_633980 [Mycena pura]|uniref:F-box domain-containing protein n=1 Tax=Mycena pura TaxID=153505 RepID=A0AAD6VCK6_9AGAR|nr:hypothetical protein GGX14DRAFT_633980 [Mycena pura]